MSLVPIDVAFLGRGLPSTSAYQQRGTPLVLSHYLLLSPLLFVTLLLYYNYFVFGAIQNDINA